MSIELLNDLHLMRPYFLWVLLPAGLLAGLLWRQRGRSGSWTSVIAPELLPHLVSTEQVARTRNLLPLLGLGWVLATFAAAGPSWQQLPQPVHQKQDALVVVMDLSYSMKSADLAPSRLDRSRQKVLDLLNRREEGQTALIAYAGDAHTVTPLTDDNPTIANLLPALNPDMMPLRGSDSVAAIEQAVALLRSAGIRGGRILLVTDGIEADDVAPTRTALADSGAQLFILGVGTETGAPIPLNRGGFLKDSSGAIVMPTLEEAPLRQLAQSAGGQYLPMRIDGGDLDTLLAAEPLLDGDQTVALERTADAWEDQGYWLLLPLLPLVLALFRRGWIVCLLPLTLLGHIPDSAAQGWSGLWQTPDQRAMRALQDGDPARAAELFEDPDWGGTARYQNGDYAGAAEKFGAAEQATADQWYNRGNALARAGEFEAAIDAYRESLARAPGRQDAQDNLALLEQLQQQQEQEQEQEQQQDQQENDDDQQQDGEQQQQPGDQQQQPSEGGQESSEDSQSGDARQPESSPDETAESGQSESEQGQQQDEAAEANPETEPETEQTPGGQPGMAAEDPEKQERDQAMEQWLRRVPDDPSGLLREKFRYESRQRQQQQRGRSNNGKDW